ncbi:sugar nucleotide-binding protein [Streptomyces sp. WP-1]|uniref:sugar nucleotide-binding protein n=1 Tax=Streptomyces sp. WP-1 TaxID=3041497 RepID=UPI00351B6943
MHPEQQPGFTDAVPLAALGGGGGEPPVAAPDPGTGVFGARGTTTLIAGSGFVGRAVAARPAARGDNPVLASRTPPPGVTAPWVRLDATDADACAQVVGSVRPDRLVLVPGPSDVTWCEADPERAIAPHSATARHLTVAARGRRTVLISTDNVFDGSGPDNDEATPAAPANVYGRAEPAAERMVGAAPDATVPRVSLVYGWEPADSVKWLNFFAARAHLLKIAASSCQPGGRLLDSPTRATRETSRLP